MTFPASGQIADFGAELADELRTTLPLTLPSDETRWLAEVPTGPVVIPTDFYSKSAVKLTNPNSYGSSGTSHSVNVSFGPEYTGRRIVLCINTAVGTSASLDIGTVTIGGVTAVGNDAGGASGGVAAGAGIFFANPSGTSGNVVFSTANNANVRIWVLSVAGITARHDFGFSSSVLSPGGSDTVNIPANGVLIACYTRANTGAHSYTGVDQRDSVLFQGGTTRGSIAWTNRLTLQSNRTVSVSPTGSNAYGLYISSFS